MSYFISYVEEDAPWAKWVAWRLEESGSAANVGAWDSITGSSWVHNINAGISSAERIVCILSPSYLNDAVSTALWESVWAYDPLGSTRQIVTVRVRPCDRPGLLAGLNGTDIFDDDEQEAWSKLTRLLQLPSTTVVDRGISSQPYPREIERRSNQKHVSVYLPARVPSFIGRVRGLERLGAGLGRAPNLQVISLKGLGGVGKTSIALEYAYKNVDNYGLVHHVRGSDPALLATEFHRLLRYAGQPGTDQNAAALKGAVHEVLGSTQDWLILFDDSPSPAAISEWLQPIIGSVNSRHHVIVTTRRSGFAALGQVISLEPFTPEEGHEFLEVRLGAPQDRNDAQALSTALGGLPLALEQACCYIERTGCSVREYLQYWDTFAVELLSAGGEEQTVATVWRISVEALKAQALPALQFLQIASWMDADWIPLSLFTRQIELLPQPLQAAACSPITLNEVIAALTDYSLMSRGASGVKFHGLLQTVMRQMSEPDEFNGPGTFSPRAAALQLLAQDMPGTSWGAPEAWPHWKMLLPHVLAILRLVSSPETGLSTNEQEWVLHLVRGAAEYLWVMGDPGSALPLIQMAVEVAESRYGAESHALADTVGAMALMMRDIGDIDSAVQLARRALNIEELTGEGQARHRARRHNDLAGLLRVKSEYPEAIMHARHALDIDSESEAGRAQLGFDLGRLAAILNDAGNSEEALPLAREALIAEVNARGPRHPNVALRLGVLADICMSLEEYSEAARYCVEAEAINEAHFGTSHPNYAISLERSARLAAILGDATKAVELINEALGIDETTLGRSHPNYIQKRVLLERLQAGPNHA